MRSHRSEGKRAENPLIALLTDFGTRDPYVGIMKAVVWGICPGARLLDLTHEIPAQSIFAAAFALKTALPYLPSGAILVAVVDPGVGTPRRAVAIQTTRHLLVGPDNGIFSRALEADPVLTAVELSEPRFWGTPVLSGTFHGRDLFAPVAAHLANGESPAGMGKPVDPASLIALPPWPLRALSDGLEGVVIGFDHFGTAITSIALPPGADHPPILRVESEGREWPWVQTYGAAAPGSRVSVRGSHGHLELAVVNGRAGDAAELAEGSVVRVRWQETEPKG